MITVGVPPDLSGDAVLAHAAPVMARAAQAMTQKA
jgi:hypothetical protein